MSDFTCRDIKRYNYEWADLWLIATFPSLHYDIEKYPSVKQYLLSYGIERLEQTGMVHNVNGVKIKARKKTIISGLEHKIVSVIGTFYHRLSCHFSL